MITRDRAREMAQIGVSYVGVSLDGPDQVLDLFRCVKGAFNAALAGVANCHDAGLKTGLRFTITPHNHEHAGAIFDIARQTGTRRICFYHLVRTGRASELQEPYLDAASVRNVLDMIMTRTSEFVNKSLVDEVLTVGNHADGPFLLLRMSQENHPGRDRVHELLKTNGGNRSGQNIACIGWDGSVYADQFWRSYTLGNVLEKPFGQIWDNPDDPVLKMLRDKKLYADNRCKSCRWFDICGGNYRFLGSDPAQENWCLEPPCYLKESEISRES
jgi:radical SAM protein with 4Fe4S-binding SPASM domain